MNSGGGIEKNLNYVIMVKDQFTDVFSKYVMALQFTQFFFTLYLTLKTYKSFKKEWKKHINKVKNYYALSNKNNRHPIMKIIRKTGYLFMS